MIKESIKRKYTCPHCFTKFAKQQALARCQSIPEICDHEEDAVYNHHHPKGVIERQGRLIEAQNQDLLKRLNDSDRQKCDLCAHTTEQRVCPTCHHNLAKDFFATNYIHIGVIGAMTSQLAHYVTMARQVFVDNEAHNLGLKINPSENKDLEICFENLEKSNSALNKVKSTPDFQTIVFHNISEEKNNIDFDKYDSFFYWVPIPTLPLKYNAFEDLLQLIFKAPMAGKKKISKPFAIGYHSFEKLAPLLPDANILLRNSEHKNGFDQHNNQQISGELMAYTGAWYGANTLHFIKRHLPKYQFFTFSLTYPNDQIASYGSGWRITDPLVWLLYQHGVIKEKGQKDQFLAGIAQILGAKKRATKV